MPSIRQWTVVCTLLFCLPPAAARITAVHLHPGGAEITQTVAVTADRVVLQGLPEDLDIAQVRIDPDEGLVVQSMDLRTLHAEAQHGERVETLRGQLADVEDRIALLVRRQADRDIVRSLLQHSDKDEDSARVRDPFPAILEVLERLSTEEIDDRATRRSLQEERDRIQAELDELGKPARPAQTLEVALSGSGERLRVRYPVSDARFELRYRLGFDSARGSVRIEPRLLVAQNTGNDWTDVALSASTTRRSYRLAVPDPKVRVLRPLPKQPPPQPARMRGADQAVAEMAASAAPPAAQAQAQTYDIRYTLSAPVSVPADNRPRPFGLDPLTIDAQAHALIVPQREAAAYLVAEWRMADDMALAAGRAEILRDGVLVGHEHLPMLLPGQERRQGFGIDPALEVTVVSDPIKRDESLFGGSQRWEQMRKVTVDSAHRSPVELRLRDTAPVAGDGDISVRLTGDEPTEQDVDEREGLHEWRATLAPGATQEWSYGSIVSAPRDMELGL